MGCEGLEAVTGAEAPDRKEGTAGLKSPRAATILNLHPTVKPINLMRWLVRLGCPIGGVIIDPFVGSGTTIIAAKLEGMDAIGIDLDADYLKIADGRVSAWEQYRDDAP